MITFARPTRLGRIGRLVCIVVLLLVLAFCLVPDVRADGGPQLNVIDVNTSSYPAVKVTVEALGSDGLPITGLTGGAFAVYENGRQQSVESGDALQATTTPLTVMLVLDTSLSMAESGKIQSAKDAATAFVNQMRPIDRVGLIQFDSEFSLRSPFTSDHAALVNKIEQLTPQGNTRIYDALYLALQQTKAASGSKAIVVLTDGQDTESAIDLVHALALVHDSGIRVYTIGIGSDIDANALDQIAAESGGRSYSAPTAEDIGYTFQLMSNQLRNRYEIDYRSPATATIGTKVALRLTAQTGQGLASAETNYVTPAFARSSTMDTPAEAEAHESSTFLGLNTAYETGGLVALGVLLAAAGLALVQSQRERESRLAFFLGSGIGEQAAGERRSLFGELAVGVARVIAGIITRLLPPNQVQRLSRQLMHAGNPMGWRVAQFVAAKFVLGVVGLIFGALLALRTDNVIRGVIVTISLGFLGYRLPTFWIKRRIKARRDAILRTLPDALDLLTICVEAGLSLDGAMLEVVNRWDNALSDEFAIVLAELKMGRGRRDALRGMADRVGLLEVTTFTSAMVQADELGMGIARTLSLQAQQLRTKRKQRAEKLAHEASVKMVVAMGVLIMPALFMIIMSPAVVQIRSMFGGG
ncbi:MAG TPA: VWA domain-containing protein [Nitrolancea sp.]|nr:VWA domain-containing protein [Nitrolancea sp.]